MSEVIANQSEGESNDENSQEGQIERTDHDRLFKQLFTTFFVEFLQIFLAEVLKYLNISSLVSREQEIFTDVTSGEKHIIDILMQGQFSQPTEAWATGAFFLLHIENQSSSDTNFPKRMFRYFARLLEKHDLPIYPIAVFSYDNPLYAAPNEYKVAFPDQDVLQFKYKLIQLNQLDWQDFVKQPNPVASALMAKMKIAPEDRPLVKATCMAMMLGLHLDEARNELIKNFVDTYLELTETEEQQFETELIRLIPPAEKENAMQVLDLWTRRGLEQGREEGLEQGREEGLEQGREEGERNGELKIVLRLLTRKLGQPLSPEIEKQVRELSVTQLTALGEALLDFTSSQDLTNWLETVVANVNE